MFASSESGGRSDCIRGVRGRGVSEAAALVALASVLRSVP